MWVKNSPLCSAVAFMTLVMLYLSNGVSDAFSHQAVDLAWFYKPPHDGNLTHLAQHFRTFILTKVDEPERDELRRQGVASLFLQYVRFDAIHDPCYSICPCNTQPYRNQVAWVIGDYCRLRVQHPDWFLRDTAGNEVALFDGPQRYVWMDPGHPGWRAFWLARVRHSQEQLGWDGVFLDNVEASLGKYERHQVQLANALREVWLYDNYTLDLGEPLGPRYWDGGGWRRHFTRGSVRVDPFAHTAEIKVDERG